MAIRGPVAADTANGLNAALPAADRLGAVTHVEPIGPRLGVLSCSPELCRNGVARLARDPLAETSTQGLISADSRTRLSAQQPVGVFRSPCRQATKVAVKPDGFVSPIRLESEMSPARAA